MKLIKIRLSELQEFINSDTYFKFTVKPISPKRVISYINNPNGKSSDVVLYYIVENNELIAFRTIWADLIYNKEKAERFGWLSGNWVSEQYRGKGLAQISLKEAINDWNNKLMYTNFSMLSLISYNKSKAFKSFCERTGARAYFSFSTLSRFKRKKILIPFLFIADIGIYILSRFIKFFYSYKISEKYSFEVMDVPDEECLNFAESKKNELIFRRGSTELNWIFSYPWMTNNINDNLSNYPFSSYAKEFYYKIVKVFDESIFAGFFVISVRNRNLKTLCFYISDMDYNVILKWIKNYAIKNNLSMVTIFNERLMSCLRKKPLPFLYTKDFGNNIYTTFDFQNIAGLEIQDGDGDYIFT